MLGWPTKKLEILTLQKNCRPRKCLRNQQQIPFSTLSKFPTQLSYNISFDFVTMKLRGRKTTKNSTQN